METKKNFRGEPIHQPEFLAKVEAARVAVVGRHVTITSLSSGDTEQGSCTEIAIVPDADSIDVVLASGTRYGMRIEEVGAESISGPTGALSQAYARRIVTVFTP